MSLSRLLPSSMVSWFSGAVADPLHGLFRRVLPAVILAGALAPAAASPIHRCESGGAITFQNTPCADGQGSRPVPSQGVTAQRVQPASGARNQAAYRAAAAPALAEERARLGGDGPGRPGVAPRSPAAGGDFRCDGRQHCSQMRSCTEARYFLAHCPDVKMDGDADGIPCEEQLCGH